MSVHIANDGRIQSARRTLVLTSCSPARASRFVTGVTVDANVDFFDDSDDAALLARARAGDSRSADVLWIRVRPAVLAVARSIADKKQDAEDLASEAMTKVFAAIAAGQGPSESVLPYINTTMRNLHLTGLRRQARIGEPLELDEQRTLNLVAPAADALESEFVTKAFTSLPERWRYVLWASLVEGRPGAEIGAELGIRPAAVHALKSRALEGLRQQYLSEHAKLADEQECAAVHSDLASIARGRARRSTDVAQVWRHLRRCEHCAEGYQEITAINNRIGALLGPAAIGVASLVPHAGRSGLAELFRVPAAAGNAAVAAGVAGVIAISGTAFTIVEQDRSPREPLAAAVSRDVGPGAHPLDLRTAVPPAAPRAVAQGSREALPTSCGLTPASVPPDLAPRGLLASITPVPPTPCSAAEVAPGAGSADPAATIAGLTPPGLPVGSVNGAAPRGPALPSVGVPTLAPVRLPAAPTPSPGLTLP